MTHDKELEQAGKFGEGDGLKQAANSAMSIAHEYWENGNRDDLAERFRAFSAFLRARSEEKYTEGRLLNPKPRPLARDINGEEKK